MRKPIVRLLLAPVVGLALLGFALLVVSIRPAGAQQPWPVCFWSAQGPVVAERTVLAGAAGFDPHPALRALLAGPTAEEQAQGMWSAVPAGTTLAGVDVLPTAIGGVQPERTVVVRLRVPEEALRQIDHETFEILVTQLAWTLESVGWGDLRIQTWDAAAGQFVPLADFLPPVGVPGKETLVAAEEEPQPVPVGGASPPGAGQGQPQGALSGRTVYVSAGHGWQWNGYAWRTQRPPYPNPPYVGPIIEDHNNAEAVNQYLLRYLWNAGATVIPVRERDMSASEAVVDNSAAVGYAETGTWTTTSSGGYANTSYRWAATVTGAPTATAVWTATVPSDGELAVYAWYRQGTNRSVDAHYMVHHAGGTTEVVVNQQIHGNTWHYLGSYGFLAGQEARVTLTNHSSVAGQVVVADAVRFGGGTFDDLTGIETTAPYPPDVPWWEVAAFYYTQRMGMEQPDNDVVARPVYARWEHAGTDEDAVYVSWHTNGVTGYQTYARGTISIIHNGEGYPVTPGSQALRDAIHTELVHDIRAGWDPTWPGQTRAMNLGELRELYDADDPSNSLPGALIEIAYHDHPGDTDALKEPSFEMLVARAIYQGILHYFDAGAVELPEPPTHLRVQNAGGGQVRVSWQPSPTDTIGLVGDAATGYRVYTSTNGVGWSNGVPVAGTTAYTLTGLPAGQLLFVRVSATNAGGESFPTETLVARVGDEAGVLLVSGFDRLNRTMLVPDYDPIEGYNLRMLLDRMNRYDYVRQHGLPIGYALDSASNEAVRDGLVPLTDYWLVDWILGEESTVDETLNATEQGLLAGFVGDGGALFISGAEIGWDLDYLGTAADRAFYNTHLRADYAGDDAGTYEVLPAPGSIFAGLLPFRFDAAGMYDADYPDQLAPLGGAVPALSYSGGLGGTAAVQYAAGCQRLVYFGFPFETIQADRRAAVMGRVLDFLDECGLQPMQTTITSPADGGVYLSAPAFQGTAAGGWGVERVEVLVQRASDGRTWDGSSWVVGTVWLTATGTAEWSYVLPALQGGIYEVRARSWDDHGAVDASPAVASFRVVREIVHLPLAFQQYEEPGPCSEAIVNGGFESGEGWTLNRLATYNTTVVHQGARSARVGILPGNPGDFVYSSVAQVITLPTATTATLHLWVYPFGEGGDPGDSHYLGLFDHWGDYHILDGWQSDARSWQYRQYDLSAFLGQTVTLYIGTLNDGDGDTAAMYVDDVSLEVCP